MSLSRPSPPLPADSDVWSLWVDVWATPESCPSAPAPPPPHVVEDDRFPHTVGAAPGAAAAGVRSSSALVAVRPRRRGADHVRGRLRGSAAAAVRAARLGRVAEGAGTAAAERTRDRPERGGPAVAAGVHGAAGGTAGADRDRNRRAGLDREPFRNIDDRAAAAAAHAAAAAAAHDEDTRDVGVVAQRDRAARKERHDRRVVGEKGRRHARARRRDGRRRGRRARGNREREEEGNQFFHGRMVGWSDGRSVNRSDGRKIVAGIREPDNPGTRSPGSIIPHFPRACHAKNADSHGREFALPRDSPPCIVRQPAIDDRGWWLSLVENRISALETRPSARRGPSPRRRKADMAWVAGCAARTPPPMRMGD